jgi:hypothetical protein
MIDTITCMVLLEKVGSLFTLSVQKLTAQGLFDVAAACASARGTQATTGPRLFLF